MPREGLGLPGPIPFHQHQDLLGKYRGLDPFNCGNPEKAGVEAWAAPKLGGFWAVGCSKQKWGSNLKTRIWCAGTEDCWG